MLGPILTGEKIRLAPATTEYLPEFVKWFADMEITRYLSMRHPPSLDQEAGWFERMCADPNTVHWTMLAGDRPIGVTGIHNVDWMNRGAITGTVIGVASEWGKGYASEAVAMRTAYAFEELNLERLESMSASANLGMHKALERSGYRQIGVRAHYMFREGNWVDMVMFEILRDDYYRRQK